MSRSVLERIYHERRNDLIRYCEALLLHDPKYRAQAEEIILRELIYEEDAV